MRELGQIDGAGEGGDPALVAADKGQARWEPGFSGPVEVRMQVKDKAGNLGEATELLDLVKRARIPSIPITKRPLDSADATLQDLRAGKLIGRAVLTP